VTTPELNVPDDAMYKHREAGGTETGSGATGSCFLRRRSWLNILLGLTFAAACVGGVVLAALYNWPTANVLVYYFVMRPAFVWFGMLAPFVAVGVFSVRLRCLLCGCVLFLVCFLASEEIVQVLKFFPQKSREDFVAAKMAFRSYMNSGVRTVERLNIPLRIVTWNVAGGELGAGRGIAELGSLQPDIVFFQECWGGRNFKDAIKRCREFQGFYLVEGPRPILSRFPITRLAADRFLTTLGHLWLIEAAPGMPIICANVHLSPVDLRTQVIRGWTRSMLQDAIDRTRQQLDAVRAGLDQYAGMAPIIMAGDFNLLCEPRSASRIALQRTVTVGEGRLRQGCRWFGLT